MSSRGWINSIGGKQTHLHTWMHARTHTHTHTHTCPPTHARKGIHTRTHTHTHTRTLAHPHMHMHARKDVHIHTRTRSRTRTVIYEKYIVCLWGCTHALTAALNVHASYDPFRQGKAPHCLLVSLLSSHSSPEFMVVRGNTDSRPLFAWENDC